MASDLLGSGFEGFRSRPSSALKFARK